MADELKPLAIDLGDDPIAPPPTEGQQNQIRNVIRAAAKDYVDSELADKADLDPESGRLLDEQLPEQIEAKILLRFGTRSELDNADPPLEDNEPAYETDTGFYRLGATRYPSLQFVQELLVAIDATQIVSGKLDADRLPDSVMLQNQYHPGYAGFYNYVNSFSVVDTPVFQPVAGRFRVGVDYDVMAETTVDIYGSKDYGLRFYVPAFSGEAYLLISDQRGGGFDNFQYLFPAESGRLLTDATPLLESNMPPSIARVDDIAALRQQLNATKQPLGGVWLDGMGGRIFIPPVPFVVGQTTVVCWYGSILHPDNSDRVIIQSGGASGYNVMRRGSNWLVAITNTASGNWATVNLPNPPASGDEGFWELEFDLTAGLAVTLRKDGESISTASTTSTSGTIGNDFEQGVMYGSASGSTARSVGGLVRSLSVLNRALTSDERQQLLSSGGQIMPLTVRAHCVFDLLMDEGAGRQLRDRSGNTSDGQGLLSATGYTHLIPKDKATIRATAVDASSAMYLLAASDILPANAVVTGLIVDGTPIALSATAQPNARRRIRLAPSGGNLSVERSDGTNHTALATPIPVADLANLALCINYQII